MLSASGFYYVHHKCKLIMEPILGYWMWQKWKFNMAFVQARDSCRKPIRRKLAVRDSSRVQRNFPFPFSTPTFILAMKVLRNRKYYRNIPFIARKWANLS